MDMRGGTDRQTNTDYSPESVNMRGGTDGETNTGVRGDRQTDK